MLRRFMFLAMLTFAVSPAFANEPQQSESVGGTSVESVTLSEVKWLFSGTGGELWRARLARFRFERVAEVTTESGEATARLILRASSREVLDRITDGAFSLQVPPTSPSQKERSPICRMVGLARCQLTSPTSTSLWNRPVKR